MLLATTILYLQVLDCQKNISETESLLVTLSLQHLQSYSITIKQPHLTTNTDIPIITSCNVVIASHINSSVKIPLSTTIIIALHVADRKYNKEW